jgi:hypothetical protein
MSARSLAQTSALIRQRIKPELVTSQRFLPRMHCRQDKGCVLGNLVTVPGFLSSCCRRVIVCGE